MSSRLVHYRKGDVVLVSFPYNAGNGQVQTKRRPAVIVSNDYNNERLDDVLVVPLSSKNAKTGPDPYSVVVSMNSPEGQAAGLRLDSVINCTQIATIPKTLLVSKIGRFPQETVLQVDECIRRSIDLGDGDAQGAGVPR